MIVITLPNDVFLRLAAVDRAFFVPRLLRAIGESVAEVWCFEMRLERGFVVVVFDKL